MSHVTSCSPQTVPTSNGSLRWCFSGKVRDWLDSFEDFPGSHWKSFADSSGCPAWQAVERVIRVILSSLHKKSTRPKRIDKFRDQEITGVAFNYDKGSETTTGFFLLGYDIGRKENLPVTEIQFFRVPNTTRFIVVAALNRLYTFHETLKLGEKPLLQNIFTLYYQKKLCSTRKWRLKTNFRSFVST